MGRSFFFFLAVGVLFSGPAASVGPAHWSAKLCVWCVWGAHRGRHLGIK